MSHDDVKIGMRVMTPDGLGVVVEVDDTLTRVKVKNDLWWYRDSEIHVHGGIYTREDLIRVVLGQQWAVAIACWQGGSLSMRLADLPCAVDVVDGVG